MGNPLSETPAVIMAAGLGTRLRPYTFFLPKPMLPVGDRPLLEHIITWAKSYGIHRFIITVSYLRKAIEDYFESGEELGVEIQYVRSTKPLGIAGQLRTVKPYIDGTFLCLYGDAIVELDLQDLYRFHREKGSLVTLAVKPYTIQLKYGFIELGADGRLKKWEEKPEVKGLINVGCYVMEPRFLDYIPENSMFPFQEVFRRAAQAGEPIYGYITEGEFLDIGDRRQYLMANERFLKRLGVIL
jgi:mannose-1-phosphate guanylyltransferase